MWKAENLKVGGLALPLAVILGACGGGGGEPGGSPHMDNSAAVKLHPESYVERWWSECMENAACRPSGAAPVH